MDGVNVSRTHIFHSVVLLLEGCTLWGLWKVLSGSHLALMPCRVARLDSQYCSCGTPVMLGSTYPGYVPRTAVVGSIEVNLSWKLVKKDLVVSER